MRTFRLTILTSEHPLYHGTAVSTILPGADGQLGIKANHAHLVTLLRTGEVRVREAAGGIVRFMVSDGIAEVLDDHLQVVVGTGEGEGAIERARAEAAVGRARRRLRGDSRDINLDRAQAALYRGLARLRASSPLCCRCCMICGCEGSCSCPGPQQDGRRQGDRSSLPIPLHEGMR